MKSRGLFGKRGFEIQERVQDIQPPDDDHVIVKIMACGVCGTDINFVRDWPDDPMPLGHEVAAEVVETGKNVTSLKAGDRVIVEDCSMCGVCEACKSGQSQFCRNNFNMEGQPGMGEYMSVRYNCLDKFDGMDFSDACLTEPLAVSLTSVLHAEIPLGGSVVVLGNGPLGLMAAKLAKLKGAGFVAITGLGDDKPASRARFSIAGDCGCDLIVEIGKQDVDDEIKKRFPNGVDRVIVSSPPESMKDALRIIRFGGIIVFFGLHFGGRNKVEIDINDLVFRKITLRPTFAEPAINFPISNRLLKDGLVDPRVLISHTFGFDNAKPVMQSIANGTEPIVKAVMLPDG